MNIPEKSWLQFLPKLCNQKKRDISKSFEKFENRKNLSLGIDVRKLQTKFHRPRVDSSGEKLE